MNQGGTENRPCPRCGLGHEFFTPEQIAVLVAEIKIDPALAAEEEVYRERLGVCDECEALAEGVLCAHCGCFILFRARPLKSNCPHPEGDKWKRGTDYVDRHYS
jgi:hypothetical protein